MSMPMQMPPDLMSFPDGPVAVPTYFVYRDIAPGEPFDPTSPPMFWPPKDSDELFDALRAKYPQVTSHADRMRDAIIDFLIEERNSDRAFAASTTMCTTTTTTATPATWPSVSSVSTPSFHNSPELGSWATPISAGTSPQAQMPRRPTRRTTASTSRHRPGPPSLDDMTNVFSLATADQPRQRVRRKMTEAEKVEYRNRRIVKACDKCAKRKRKCNHNQTAAQTTPASSHASYKVGKAPTTAACGAPARPRPSHAPSASSHVSDVTNLWDFSPFEDLGVDFESARMAPAIDDSWRFDDFDFLDCDPSSWSGDWMYDVASHGISPENAPIASGVLRDFELFDPSSHSKSIESRRADVMLAALPDSPGLDEAGIMSPTMTSIDHLNRGGRSRPHLSWGVDGRPSPQHGSQTDADLSRSTPATTDRAAQEESTDANTPWNGFRGRLEKRLPTHTAHVHNAENGDADGMARDQSARGGRRHISTEHTTQEEHHRPPRQRNTDMGRVQRGYLQSDHRLAPEAEPSLGLRSMPDVASTTNRTLGEGVTSSANPSTEMYMLRRRIPKALHSIVDRNNHADIASTTDGLALPANAVLQTRAELDPSRPLAARRLASATLSPPAPANGGAYPRLGSMARPTRSSSAASDTTRVSSTADASAHAGLRATPAPTGSDSIAVVLSPVRHQPTSPTGSSAGQRPHSSSTDRPSDHVLHRDHHGRRAPQDDRLCDYFYVKDHNGRAAARSSSSAVGFSSVAAIAAALVLLAICVLGHAHLNPSLVLLAALALPPAANWKDAASCGSAPRSTRLGLVRCSTANSSWLAAACDRDWARGCLARWPQPQHLLALLGSLS